MLRGAGLQDWGRADPQCMTCDARNALRWSLPKACFLIPRADALEIYETRRCGQERILYREEQRS